MMYPWVQPPDPEHKNNPEGDPLIVLIVCVVAIVGMAVVIWLVRS